MKTYGYCCALLLGSSIGYLAADQASDLRATLVKYLKNPRVSAFLRVIASLESGENKPFAGYLTHYSGLYSDSWSNHHERKVCALLHGEEIWASAFGRYQIICKTWEKESGELGLKTMCPHNQDLVAVKLLLDCGSLDYILRGQIRIAVRLAREIWASFPGSPHGQSIGTMVEFEKKYKMFYEKILENRKKQAPVACKQPAARVSPD